MKVMSLRILSGVLGLALFIVIGLAFRSSAWRAVQEDEGTAPAHGTREPDDAGRELRLRGFLRAADDALERRDLVAAKEVWRLAYREALTSRRWDALVKVADAAIRFAEVAHTRGAAAETARELYVMALSHAREARSIDGILRVTDRFEALGDQALAEQAMSIAQQVAASTGSPDDMVRVATFRDNWGAGTRAEY